MLLELINEFSNGAEQKFNTKINKQTKKLYFNISRIIENLNKSQIIFKNTIKNIKHFVINLI